METLFSDKRCLDLTDDAITNMPVDTVANIIRRFAKSLPVTDPEQRQRVLSYVLRWWSLNCLEEDDMRKFLQDLRDQYRNLKERRYLVPV